MTRAAAARTWRGTTHRPTETPKKTPTYKPRAFGATDLRAFAPQAVKIGLRVAQSISSVRNPR